MFKNTGSQKLTVLAFADAGHATLDAGEPVTGDAAQITLKIEQDDDGTQSASNDTNPTEVEDGQYRFDLTQAETNGDKLTFYPESSTAGVQVVALPSNVIYTRPTNWANLESALAAYSTTRGLAGTALPAAAADAAGGLPISDAGGLDVDTLLGTLTSLAAETRDANVLDQFRRAIAMVEHTRPSHTHQPIGNIFFVDPVNGDTHANGHRGGISDPYLGVQDCHDNAVTDSNHDCIILLSGAAAGPTTLTEAVTLSKRYLFIRGPGRDFIWTRSTNGNTITVTADGIELSGFQLQTAGTGSGHGIQATDADFLRVQNLWINATQGDGINLLRCENCQIHHNWFTDSGQGGSGDGIQVDGTAGASSYNVICHNDFRDCAGDAVVIGNGTINSTRIIGNTIEGASGYGINIGAAGTDTFVADNRLGNNTSGAINNAGTDTVQLNNEQWAKDSIATETRLAELDAANVPADVDTLKTRTLHNAYRGPYGIAIHFDDAAANTNTVEGTDGTYANPVSTPAAAATLTAATGINHVVIAGGSTFTMGQSWDDTQFSGTQYTIDLNTQSIDGAVFYGAFRIYNTGTATTVPPTFHDCGFGDVVLPPCRAYHCAIGMTDGRFQISDTFALDSSISTELVDCYSAVPGTDAADVRISSTRDFMNRGYVGGCEYTLNTAATISHDQKVGGNVTITTVSVSPTVRIGGQVTNLNITATASETIVFSGQAADITITDSASVAPTITLHGIATSVTDAAGLATDNTIKQSQLLTILDDTRYGLTVLTGTISNAGEATETFVLTHGGSTYTAQITGLDASGNRSGQTLSKV